MTDASDPREPPPTTPNETAATDAALDFERAHFDNQIDLKRVCNACGTPITDSYYTHGTITVCPRCQPSYRDKLGKSSFGLALGYGLLAAAAGALVWYGIRALTSYELGIIAIAIGVAVGIAVRKGAGPSTSVLYRILAIALAYFSIISTYVPVLAADLMQGGTQPTGAAADTDTDPNQIPGPTAAPTPAATEPNEASSVRAVVSYLVATAIAFLIPALLLADGEIMGVLIMAFGLWEAWQRSAPRPEDQLAGPFQLQQAS